MTNKNSVDKANGKAAAGKNEKSKKERITPVKNIRKSTIKITADDLPESVAMDNLLDSYLGDAKNVSVNLDKMNNESIKDKKVISEIKRNKSASNCDADALVKQQITGMLVQKIVFDVKCDELTDATGNPDLIAIADAVCKQKSFIRSLAERTQRALKKSNPDVTVGNSEIIRTFRDMVEQGELITVFINKVALKFIGADNYEQMEGTIDSSTLSPGDELWMRYNVFHPNSNPDQSFFVYSDRDPTACSIMKGDTVLCAVDKSISTAYVLSVVKPISRILGRIMPRKSGFMLYSDDPAYSTFDFVLSKNSLGEAVAGDVVICEIIRRVSRNQCNVRVVSRMDNSSSLAARIQIELMSNSIPYIWNGNVKKEIEAIADEVSAKDKANRVDVTGLPLVTIDGADARDFDDAVYCRRENNGFRLFVAIADVSYYVRPGSPLDHEAKQRGTSIYFPNYVVPMLPEKLSNGLCSLNPHVDRLCMVCEMFVKKGGALGEYRFYPAVMNSHARLTYDEVAAVLSGNEVNNEEIIPLKEDLLNLYALYKELKQDRVNRGGIEFEGSESRFVFDANQEVVDILPVERNDAHMLIEECMIAANVCAADFVEKNKAATLFRVHPKPNALKVTTFRNFIRLYGLTLDGGDVPESHDYAEFARKIQDNQYRDLLQTMMLRSLSLATYTPENEGHFGLALGHYAHFTSPIRRYPDLQLHREIKYLLGKTGYYSISRGTSFGAKKYETPELTVLAEHCNLTERRADEVSGKVEASLKAKFLERFIGKSLPGVVVNVTSFGLFVKISRFNVDGLIHVSNIGNQYFEFDEKTMRLVGTGSGYSIGLGDAITVTITNVNVDDGKITMVPARAQHKKQQKISAADIAVAAKELVESYKGEGGVENNKIRDLVRNHINEWNPDNDLESPEEDDTSREMLLDTITSVGVKSAPHAKIDVHRKAPGTNAKEHKGKAGTAKKRPAGKNSSQANSVTSSRSSGAKKRSKVSKTSEAGKGGKTSG